MTVVIARREKPRPLHIFDAAWIEEKQGWRVVSMMSKDFDFERAHEAQIMCRSDQHPAIRAWLIENVGKANHFTSALGVSPMQLPEGLLITFLRPEDRLRFLDTDWTT